MARTSGTAAFRCPHAPKLEPVRLDRRLDGRAREPVRWHTVRPDDARGVPWSVFLGQSAAARLSGKGAQVGPGPRGEHIEPHSAYLRRNGARRATRRAGPARPAV